MSLRALARFATVDALFDDLDAVPRDATAQRLVVADGRRTRRAPATTRRPTVVDDPAARHRLVERAGRIAGEDEAVALPPMTPGVPSALSPLVRRVVAPTTRA